MFLHAVYSLAVKVTMVSVADSAQVAKHATAQSTTSFREPSQVRDTKQSASRSAGTAVMENGRTG